MPIDPHLQPILEDLRRQPALHTVPIVELRQDRKTRPQPAYPADRIEDRVAPGPGGDLAVRLYSSGKRGLPLVVFFHGGGFVFGGLDGYYDALCRRISAEADCAVLAVDYRLAPEHKFPAAVDDGCTVIDWAAKNADDLGIRADRILLFGISAGGNIAAAAAMRRRDGGRSDICGQVLFYPVLDFHTPARPSYSEYADGYYLTRADMVWFWKQYLADDADADNPHAAPMRAESFAGLPPSLVVSAEYDPLRDEAEAYAARLRAAGVETTLKRCDGMIHGFLAFPIPRTDEIVRDATSWIRQCFGTGTASETAPGAR